MRLFLLGLLFLHTSLPALAQGKIRFANDSLHLIYFVANPCLLLSGDAALSGQLVPASGVTPSGIPLVAELWGGTSASSLFKLTYTTLGGAGPGTITPVNLTTPFPAGVAAFFQVEVYDAHAASYAQALAGVGFYCGESPVFTTVPSGTITYNSIARTGSPAFSTWAPGGWEVDSSYYPSGALGAIALQAGPEPSTGALLALGALACLLRSRSWAVERRAAPQVVHR